MATPFEDFRPFSSNPEPTPDQRREVQAAVKSTLLGTTMATPMTFKEIVGGVKDYLRQNIPHKWVSDALRECRDEVKTAYFHAGEDILLFPPKSPDYEARIITKEVYKDGMFRRDFLRGFRAAVSRTPERAWWMELVLVSSDTQIVPLLGHVPDMSIVWRSSSLVDIRMVERWALFALTAWKTIRPEATETPEPTVTLVSHTPAVPIVPNTPKEEFPNMDINALIPILRRSTDQELQTLADLAALGLVDVKTIQSTLALKAQKAGSPAPVAPVEHVEVKALIPPTPVARDPRFAPVGNLDSDVLEGKVAPVKLQKPGQAPTQAYQEGQHTAVQFRDTLRLILGHDSLGVMTRKELRAKVEGIVNTLNYRGDFEEVALNGDGAMVPRWHKNFNTALLWLVNNDEVIKVGSVYRLKTSRKSQSAFQEGDLVSIPGQPAKLQVKEVRAVGRGYSYTLAYAAGEVRAGTVIPGTFAESKLTPRA